MKLRIRDNSLRFRLSRGEVETLRVDGSLEALTAFPGGSVLRYEIAARSDVAEPLAVFEDGAIRVRAPLNAVSGWALGDEVSLTFDIENSTDDALRVLIEKDFACLTPRPGEDESDLFPHPLAGSSRC